MKFQSRFGNQNPGFLLRRTPARAQAEPSTPPSTTQQHSRTPHHSANAHSGTKFQGLILRRTITRAQSCGTRTRNLQIRSPTFCPLLKFRGRFHNSEIPRQIRKPKSRIYYWGGRGRRPSRAHPRAPRNNIPGLRTILLREIKGRVFVTRLCS